MSLYKFGRNDIFVTNIKTYPKANFLIYSGSYYYNHEAPQSGTWSDPVTNVPVGNLSLYEYNVDRPANQFIYPFVTKQGTLTAFKTISKDSFMGFDYGDVLSGSYPLSATIDRKFYLEYTGKLPIPTANATYRPHVMALRNILNDNRRLSPHYQFSASSDSILKGWDKDTQMMTMISIPSIFYGSSIKQGSVDLKFYTTGSLAGQLIDYYKNGELIQYSGSISENNGKVAGVVLYNQGIILLTGSWDVSAHQEKYRNSATDYNAAWVYYGASGSAVNDYLKESSYTLDFEGNHTIPSLTMFAHAKKHQLNNSSNPTFVVSSSYNTNIITGSSKYMEYDKVKVKNIVSSSFVNYSASFERQTYISEIGIYDKDRNLIAIAKVANPMKKTENNDYTFKLKIDI
jgi:hypothetical protein